MCVPEGDCTEGAVTTGSVGVCTSATRKVLQKLCVSSVPPKHRISVMLWNWFERFYFYPHPPHHDVLPIPRSHSLPSALRTIHTIHERTPLFLPSPSLCLSLLQHTATTPVLLRNQRVRLAFFSASSLTMPFSLFLLNHLKGGLSLCARSLANASGVPQERGGSSCCSSPSISASLPLLVKPGPLLTEHTDVAIAKRVRPVCLMGAGDACCSWLCFCWILFN